MHIFFAMAPLNTPDGFGIWVGAFFTLCILSFLYKDNPFFRFAESIFAGCSLGYYIGNTFSQTIVPNVLEPLVHDGHTPFISWGWWVLVIPIIIGVNLYTRYIPKIAWVARFSLAIYVGYYAALEMMLKLQGEVLPQSADTIISLVPRGTPMIDWFTSIVVMIGVLCVLVYFFFSAEHKGVLGGVSKVGVWFLMISFGAAFAYTIMGRISILIGRVVFLMGDWLGYGA
ncbi:MAG: hypothetical protein GY835_26125 [bacterium]|nr:hypothetical protein [bacterium]